MRTLVRWCLGNRAVVVLFSIVLVGAGVTSVFRINQELLPSVEFPAVFVLVADPGAGPEQVDRDVSQPLVNALTGLPRASHVTSTSSQGFSQVVVEFDLDSSLDADLAAVNQRLQQVQLPPGAGRPVVQTFDFSAVPAMTYSLAATDGDLLRATREADESVVPALRGAADVAQVRVSGGAERVVLVNLDGGKLAARGLTIQQVQQALSTAQVDLPAGESLRADRSLPVRVLGSVRTADDLRALVVGAAQAETPATVPARAAQPAAAQAGPAAPTPVRLGEVATVSDTSAPLNGISRTDGVPSLQIQVVRATNGNAVRLSDDVRERVAKLHLNTADDLRLVYDSADEIRASLNDLLLEGLLGALLAVVVIFLFLRSLRATLVTAVSLPTSVLVALLGTNLGGYSLNVLTLAGLTIAVGRIVDDAIVVLENSYRHLQEGRPPREAALNGAVEVASPVISSTLTTVAVFLPIGVVGGIVSRFFLPFSITVTISLIASLLVSLTLIPVLVSFFLESRARRGSAAPPEPRPGALVRLYRPVLTWTLARGWRKAAVLAVALALLAGSSATLAFVPKDFLDFGGSTRLTGTVTLPPGTTAEQTSQRLKAFEEAARADAAVRMVQVTVASSDFGGYTRAFSGNEARLGLQLKRKDGADATVGRLQRKLDELYGRGNAQLRVQGFGPPATGFQATISGRDPETLRQASDAIVAELAGDAELTNVESNLAAEKPELLVTVDPALAAARGLAPQAVAFAVSSALSTRDVASLGPGGPEVRLRLDPTSVSVDRLAGLPLGSGVALRDVATIAETLAPEAINRVDGTRRVTVSAEIVGADVQGATERGARRLDRLSLPSGVVLESGSANEELNDAFVQMVLSIGVAVAIVFLILVTFFRSVVTPFVIILTMPLALIGGLLALFVFGQSLGLAALLGVLMVFGIVVSNAILLIDFVERDRAGRSLEEALVRAGSVRLRPILMTAVATIMALVPVAAGLSTSGGGGLISQSLALVVEGGLMSSTLLTLLVIPIVYSILRRRGGRTRPADGGPDGASWLPLGPLREDAPTSRPTAG